MKTKRAPDDNETKHATTPRPTSDQAKLVHQNRIAQDTVRAKSWAEAHRFKQESLAVPYAVVQETN